MEPQPYQLMNRENLLRVLRDLTRGAPWSRHGIFTIYRDGVLWLARPLDRRLRLYDTALTSDEFRHELIGQLYLEHATAMALTNAIRAKGWGTAYTILRDVMGNVPVYDLGELPDGPAAPTIQSPRLKIRNPGG